MPGALSALELADSYIRTGRQVVSLSSAVRLQCRLALESHAEVAALFGDGAEQLIERISRVFSVRPLPLPFRFRGMQIPVGGTAITRTMTLISLCSMHF